MKCDRHDDTKSSEGQAGEVPVGPPFLHAVGESIASFLGPLGVEVHTYASTEPGMLLKCVNRVFSEVWALNMTLLNCFYKKIKLKRVCPPV